MKKILRHRTLRDPLVLPGLRAGSARAPRSPTLPKIVSVCDAPSFPPRSATPVLTPFDLFRAQVSATLIFLISVAANARREMMNDASAGDFAEVSTSAYSVVAYLAVGSAGLWAFFRAHSAPLTSAEVMLSGRTAVPNGASWVRIYGG